jgi:formaldehyde-activating enzyme involved in methanogenesis
VYEILSGKYRCSVCNAVSDSPAVGLNDPEKSEQMAIKPDENFIAPDLFDKRGIYHKA